MCTTREHAVAHNRWPSLDYYDSLILCKVCWLSFFVHVCSLAANDFCCWSFLLHCFEWIYPEYKCGKLEFSGCLHMTYVHVHRSSHPLNFLAHKYALLKIRGYKRCIKIFCVTLWRLQYICKLGFCRYSVVIFALNVRRISQPPPTHRF